MKRILSLLLPILLLAACSSAGSTAPPSGSPGAAGRQVTSVEDAAARVIEVNPSLAGVGPKDPNMIGACCWYTGSETGDGYTVTFEVGWGDCPAGCINRHSWTFAVSKDGAVTRHRRAGPAGPARHAGQRHQVRRRRLRRHDGRRDPARWQRHRGPRHGRPHLPRRPPRRPGLRRPAARRGHDRRPDRRRQRGRPNDHRRERLLRDHVAVGAVHDRASAGRGHGPRLAAGTGRRRRGRDDGRHPVRHRHPLIQSRVA